MTNPLKSSAILQIVGYIGTDTYKNRFMITTCTYEQSTAFLFITRNGLYRTSFSITSSTKIGFGPVVEYNDGTDITDMHILLVKALQ